jgi:hypothetical protein
MSTRPWAPRVLRLTYTIPPRVTTPLPLWSPHRIFASTHLQPTRVPPPYSSLQCGLIYSAPRSISVILTRLLCCIESYTCWRRGRRSRMAQYSQEQRSASLKLSFMIELLRCCITRTASALPRSAAARGDRDCHGRCLMPRVCVVPASVT